MANRISIPHAQWKFLRERMLAVLEEAQKERADLNRAPLIAGEPAFVVNERTRMFSAVLFERLKLGQPPIPISSIMRVESMASGHVDYTTKFALYCAELVIEDAPHA